MAEIGLHADDANVRVQLFQSPRQSHQGARGAQGGHDGGDPAAGLFPDFIGRAVVMGLPVGLVVVLIGDVVLIREFAGQPVGLLDGAVRAEMARRQANLRAPCAKDLLALHAGIFRHGEQQAVSFDGAHQGQTDTGVTAGRLHDGLLGGQLAGPFGRFDHEHRGPILDGTARIQIFQLGQDRDLGIGVDPSDLDQGGVADQIEDS